LVYVCGADLSRICQILRMQKPSTVSKPGLNCLHIDIIVCQRGESNEVLSELLEVASKVLWRHRAGAAGEQDIVQGRWLARSCRGCGRRGRLGRIGELVQGAPGSSCRGGGRRGRAGEATGEVMQGRQGARLAVRRR
jgi:hypothetical protein